MQGTHADLAFFSSIALHLERAPRVPLGGLRGPVNLAPKVSLSQATGEQKLGCPEGGSRKDSSPASQTHPGPPAAQGGWLTFPFNSMSRPAAPNQFLFCLNLTRVHQLLATESIGINTFVDDVQTDRVNGSRVLICVFLQFSENI